jgi:DMSO reductase iron-sulfur subunit
MTFADLGVLGMSIAESGTEPLVVTSLIPERPLEQGEQYRFHFNMTKCIGCRSCEIACNEQNGNPTDIRWRRLGEIEGGSYPDTQRHYLSMGCNHCLDADCVKGCPVEAYTKDPVTGIVLHSADACIGCQYCVWNCPYSVPKFNPERGVVGKCDMCHGRLTDGLEPACVNACPEAAIEIEIVHIATWRADYGTAESPGMPAAVHTISTTRITLPDQSATVLERVDAGHIRPEHPHFSLVLMTTLLQAVAGSLTAALICKGTGPLLLVTLLLITSVALNISVFHLGRPAYAWRALKMWKRSWLSREVLLFGLFFVALTMFTAASWATALSHSPAVMRAATALSPRVAHLPIQPLWLSTRFGLGWLAALLGIAGTIASAFIYLVPARPAWNMVHTPVDFLLSGALLGALLPTALNRVAFSISHLPLSGMVQLAPLSPSTASPNARPVVLCAILWLANQAIRLIRLKRSTLFEANATAKLLNTPNLRPVLVLSLALVCLAAVLSICGAWAVAVLTAMAGILLSRYLFFVSVVPLNMALTFARWGRL